MWIFNFFFFVCLDIIDSPYRSALSGAVLRLQEQGKLTKLKNKWWKEKKGGGACTVSHCRPESGRTLCAYVSGDFMRKFSLENVKGC